MTAIVGMIGPSRLLDDGQAALVERLGLGVAALRTVEEGEIVERDGNRGVIGPVEALGERECLQRDGYSLVDLAGQAELIDLRVECAELVSRLGESRDGGPAIDPARASRTAKLNRKARITFPSRWCLTPIEPDALSGRNLTAS